MAEIEWAAWNDQVVPELERMKQEFLPAGTVYEDPNRNVPENERVRTRVIYTGLFTPDSSTVELSKPEIVRWLLGSHEYLLQCIEAWATQITVRYGLDVMFDIQWTLWGDSVLPGVKKLKAEYLGITGNTVADWMKDIQVDATAMPGKAFDVSFEMPEPDVGIMTFNRCVAADQWEAMGRPDILEKNCHSTCPEVDDRDDQDVQPQHEGRHPRHPAPQGSRQRVLQVAFQHADSRRSRVREGPRRAHQQARPRLTGTSPREAPRVAKVSIPEA